MTAYFCNKCGYSGADQYPHQRPGSNSECAYVACAVPPSPPGQCSHLGECNAPQECFRMPAQCRRALGVTTKEEDRG